MKDFRIEPQPRRETSGIHEGGFSLVELLITSLILLLLSVSVFNSLADSQSVTGYQAQVQAVLENSRTALDTVERYLRQAGNDPLRRGGAGITITGPTEVTVKSDLTGSAGAADPDKGDPDGDFLDAGEDVTIRYDAAARTVELVPASGRPQTIASYISAFSMQFYDAAGAITSSGANVRRVKVTVSGTSTAANPKTRKTFGITLTSDVQIATRQY